jgi:phosphoglycolate phosphatase
MPAKNGNRLILFDCDGTLVDSQGPILTTMAQAFLEFGLKAPPAGAVRRVIGLMLSKAIAELAPALSSADHDRLVKNYKAIYASARTEPGHDEPLYPGVVPVLDRLRADGFLLGVATGKARRGLDATLALHGLADRFVTLQTSDNNPSKPHPGMVLKAMEATGAEPGATLVVGDTSFDMNMARNAGVMAVGVSWGYHPPEELSAAGAVAVIRDFAALLPFAADLGGGKSRA